MVAAVDGSFALTYLTFFQYGEDRWSKHVKKRHIPKVVTQRYQTLSIRYRDDLR